MRVLIATLMIAFASPVFAQTQLCLPTHAFLENLRKSFNEFPVFRARVDGERSIIITRSDGQGTWTLLQVSGGQACMTASGNESRFDKGV